MKSVPVDYRLKLVFQQCSLANLLKYLSVQSIYPLLTKAVKLLCVYTEYINMVQMFRLGGFLLHSSVPFKHASSFFFKFILETGKHITGQPSNEMTDRTRNDIMESIETCIIHVIL